MPDEFKIVGHPTWRNTLHNDARKFHHISEIAKAAVLCGYPYICWNDRVYEISKYWEDVDNPPDHWMRDTSLSVDDIL